METKFKKPVIFLLIIMFVVGYQFDSFSQGKSEKGKEKKGNGQE